MPRSQILGVFLNDAMERRDRDAYGYYGRTLETRVNRRSRRVAKDGDDGSLRAGERAAREVSR